MPPESRRNWWNTVVWVMLASGLVLSLVCGVVWASQQRADNHRRFAGDASSVTVALGTMLSRDTDFVAMLRTIAEMEPRLSASRFDSWYARLEGKQRQVGSLGTSVVTSVGANALRRFVRWRNADPEFSSLLGRKPFPLAQDGDRRYCLLSAGHTVVPFTRATARLLQGDWCDRRSPIGAMQAKINQEAADSGQLLTFPITNDGVRTIFIEAAYYRRGASTSNVRERRAALAGWVLSSFDLRALLRRALGDNRWMRLQLYHRNPGDQDKLLGADGRIVESHEAFVTNTPLSAGAAWTAHLSGVPPNELSAETQGAIITAAGACVTILVALLLWALARSRQDALVMVAETTAELRHQTLHDPLTGLPNRVLAIDRAQQLLARARRERCPAAALYIDLDGFKEINDTLGHAAGDELLKQVGSRLQTGGRESDTAARLSGDEFLVLLTPSPLDAGPSLVAERILEALRQPYALTQSEKEVHVSASIGIARGIDLTAEGLLQNADHAMYAVKQHRKNGAMEYASVGAESVGRHLLSLDVADTLTARSQPLADAQHR
jgi:diguanylate cyclase (GGDEF)-like protein